MNGLEKGKTLFKNQEFKKAIEELNTFLSEQANNADALYTRAICYRKIDEFEKSIEDLSSILLRLPNEPSLLCERGISYFQNKNIEAAMKDMDKAVELDSNNPYRYSSRAYIKANIDIDGAMADYEKAIKLDPKDEISLNNLGLLQENAGKMKAAKKSYQKSNELIGYDPEKRQEIQAKKNHEDIAQDSLGKIMLNVFSSKKTRQEYFQFLKSLFYRKT
jgi:Flp pilus assembly protein TadD